MGRSVAGRLVECCGCPEGGLLEAARETTLGVLVVPPSNDDTIELPPHDPTAMIGAKRSAWNPGVLSEPLERLERMPPTSQIPRLERPPAIGDASLA
jgi:hypothetical protein